MADEGANNLTGVWDGLFSYPWGYGPVTFTAVLLDVGGALSGTIHETAKEGPNAGETLNAMLTGHCAGSSVDFLKTYDQALRPHYTAVSYRGALNADATEIEGFWTVPGAWSGKFLMIRQRGQKAARKARRRITEPVK